MLQYLLDSNVFIVSQRANRLTDLVTAAATVPMAMVNDVRDELTVARPNRRENPGMREASQTLGKGGIEVIQVLPGSPEDDLRTELARAVGKGEAASIAVASQRQDLIFVSDDAKAVAGGPKLYRGLPGPYGRIIGLHAFLRTLVERDALDTSIARGISAIAKLSSNLDPPLWWGPWENRRSGISAP